MADLQHTALTSAEVHEPKNITANGTASSGKVITNSGSTPSISEYRRLKSADIEETDVWITAYESDSTAAEDTYFISPVNGTVEEIKSVISDPLVTADMIFTIDVAGGATTPATFTVTQAGSAAGDVDTVTITAGGGILVDETIKLTNNGGNTDAAVDTWFQIRIRRT